MHPHITVEYLQECFELDALQGRLTWRVRPANHFTNEKICNMWNARHAGNRAGAVVTTNNSTPYRRVCVANKYFYEHRIIFALTYYRWPNLKIDHKDGDGLNNVPTNLREATQVENQFNRLTNKNNMSGYKGVWNRVLNRWQGKLKSNYKPLWWGFSENPVTFALQYDDAARKFHGEFACLNFPDRAVGERAEQEYAQKFCGV